MSDLVINTNCHAKSQFFLQQINKMVELIMAQKKAAEQMLMAEMPGVPGMKVNPKYEYDSDEDTEGGTWEHKQRRQEMDATRGETCCHGDIDLYFTVH